VGNSCDPRIGTTPRYSLSLRVFPPELQFAALCTDKAVCIPVAAHVFNSADLLFEFLRLLRFVVGGYKTGLPIVPQVQEVLQTLISGICRHLLIFGLLHILHALHEWKTPGIEPDRLKS